jgi:hypothetical protein
MFVTEEIVIRKIVFAGNCQLAMLTSLYRRVVVPETEDVVDYVPSYQDASTQQRRAIAEADVLVSQVLDFIPRIGDLETTAKVHLVPNVTAAFLWPYTGSPHPRNVPEPMLDVSGPYPAELGDSFLNRMIAGDVPAETAVARYLETDVAKVRNLGRLMELVMDRQRKRDNACGFHFADFIESNFRTTRLFRSPNHPETPMAMKLATDVYESIGVDSRITAKMCAEPPADLFPATEAPLHPGVIAYFGLTHADVNTRYRHFHEGSFTFAEYALRYMRYEWNSVLAQGIHLARQGHVKGAAVVLEQAIARSPRSCDGHFVLANMLAHQGRMREATERTFQAVVLDPGNGHFQRRLDHLLAQSGV